MRDEELKLFSGKARQSLQDDFNPKFVIIDILGNGFEVTLMSKTNLKSLWSSMLQFFGNFLVTKLKPFSGKVRQSLPNYLNQNLVIGSFLGNSFQATLSSKTNVLIVWKGHFSVFWKFLNDKVEIIFWENKAKHQKLFKLKFRHRKLLTKWFWRFLEFKNECSECLKRTFFSFCTFLFNEVENVFWESEAIHEKVFKLKFG